MILKKYTFLIIAFFFSSLFLSSCIEYKDVEVKDVSDIRVKSLLLIK